MSTLPNTSILASAGTGKTFQLSDRIVKLLAGGVKHEEIAALTFTRAAAAEFVVKVMCKLREAAEDVDLRNDLCTRLNLNPRQFNTEKFRTMLRQALLSSHRLTMGTLDGFFAKMVNTFPLEVGLNTGTSKTISEQEIHTHRLYAVESIIQNLDSSDFNSLLTNLKDYNDDKEIANPLESWVELTKQYHDTIVFSPESSIWGNPDKIWDAQSPAWNGFADSVHPQPDWEIVELYLFQTFETENKFPKLFKILGESAKSQRCDNATGNSLAMYFLYIVQLAMGTPGSFKHRKEYSVPSDVADAIRRLVFRAIDQLVRSRLKQTQALHRCLIQYETSYDKHIRRTGLLSFNDYVTLLTKAAPFDKEEIAYRLDCTIKHWLLDEFQDTSAQQFAVLARNISEIVEQPQEDRSVFVVGDLKQSLYEWRSGNRKLLLNLHEAISNNGVNINLDETRRCAPAILEMVNAILGEHTTRGLGKFYSESASEDWSATFRQQKAVVESGKPTKLGESAWVRISKPKEYEDSDEQLQASWIAKHLKSTPHLLLPDGRLQPGITCAILVSKNKQAAEISHILRLHGVEASDETKASIIEDNPVTAGLLALLQTTVHPDNGLAKGIAEISPVSASFLNTHGGWVNATEVIANCFADEGAKGLINLLTQNVDLTDDNGFIRKRLEQFRTLALAYDATGHRDLDDFAQYCSTSELRDSADPQTVQVITIHRSKGLEYDIVYMPCLNNSRQPIAHLRTSDMLSMPVSDQDFRPKWLLASVGSNVAQLDPVLHAATSRAKSESAYGNLCRLYVGMTRAKHQLYMITLPLSDEKLSELNDGSDKADFAALLELALGNKEQTSDISYEEIKAECIWKSRESVGDWITHRLNETSTKASPPIVGINPVAKVLYHPVSILEKLRPSKSLDVDFFKWHPSSLEPSGRELGILVHELMNKLEWDVNKFLNDLKYYPISPELHHLQEPAFNIVRRCLESSSIRNLFNNTNPDTILWRERNVALVHKEKLVTAIFDRVQIIPSKEAIIIDYKTADCSLHKLQQLYQEQMEIYRIVVAQLWNMPPNKIKCVLIHMRLGQTLEI